MLAYKMKQKNTKRIFCGAIEETNIKILELLSLNKRNIIVNKKMLLSYKLLYAPVMLYNSTTRIRNVKC